MAAKRIEASVRELLDREAIRDLPLRYCHYVWKNDVAGLVSLFTADGVMVTVGDPNLPQVQERGTDNLLRLYRRLLSDLQPRPFIHNHVI
jgi:hypothetical protein